ncbi:hypothetical protein DL93DRAFT_484359 [Clavulina sp. PMI_390]|nr:hypothetical protein DL93DRAFT_484359 [Clavulina sp. PMI_390]
MDSGNSWHAYDPNGNQPPNQPKKTPKPPQPRPRIYQCDQCDRAFDRPSALSQHMYTHTGERPHLCTLCNTRRFATASNLYRHMRTCRGTGAVPQPTNVSESEEVPSSTSQSSLPNDPSRAALPPLRRYGTTPHSTSAPSGLVSISERDYEQGRAPLHHQSSHNSISTADQDFERPLAYNSELDPPSNTYPHTHSSYYGSGGGGSSLGGLTGSSASSGGGGGGWGGRDVRGDDNHSHYYGQQQQQAMYQSHHQSSYLPRLDTSSGQHNTTSASSPYSSGPGGVYTHSPTSLESPTPHYTSVPGQASSTSQYHSSYHAGLSPIQTTSYVRGDPYHPSSSTSGSGSYQAYDPATAGPYTSPPQHGHPNPQHQSAYSSANSGGSASGSHSHGQSSQYFYDTQDTPEYADTHRRTDHADLEYPPEWPDPYRQTSGGGEQRYPEHSSSSSSYYHHPQPHHTSYGSGATSGINQSQNWPSTSASPAPSGSGAHRDYFYGQSAGSDEQK